MFLFSEKLISSFSYWIWNK